MDFFEKKLSIHPNIKTELSFSVKEDVWVCEVVVFFNFRIKIKSASLDDIMSKVKKIAEQYKAFLTDAKLKKVTGGMRKSRLVIEYHGKYYLSIYKDKTLDNSYKCLIFESNSEDVTLQQAEIDVALVDGLLKSCQNIKILTHEPLGLDGWYNTLKIKIGFFNYIDIFWWSRSIKAWEGLEDVDNKLREIKEIAQLSESKNFIVLLPNNNYTFD